MQQDTPNDQNDLFFKALGLERANEFRDEPAPRPVNTKDIHDLLGGKLNDFMRDDVVFLIGNYQEWNEAYGEVLRERAVRTPEQGTRHAPPGDQDRHEVQKATNDFLNREIASLITAEACVEGAWQPTAEPQSVNVRVLGKPPVPLVNADVSLSGIQRTLVAIVYVPNEHIGVEGISLEIRVFQCGVQEVSFQVFAEMDVSVSTPPTLRIRQVSTGSGSDYTLGLGGEFVPTQAAAPEKPAVLLPRETQFAVQYATDKRVTIELNAANLLASQNETG